jgi:undecaprenyl diphosphate synthase
MQSTLIGNDLHVAIIMDGNGRWALRRGLPRPAGHRAGVEAIRRVTEAAPDLGVGTLTLFAFSTDNWRRPPDEVGALMALLRLYLRNETARLAEAGVRLSVIGRRDRLPEGLAEAIAAAEHATQDCARLHLRIAVDYSARDAILGAARAAGPLTREAMTEALADGAGEVDLLIRTAGEQRLSDFLLWECAYAELLFSDRLWPDFGADDLAACVAAFRRRDRRFGGLTATVAA